MDDKIIVSNRSVLTAKYGAAGLVKIKNSVDALIAADDKRGIKEPSHLSRQCRFHGEVQRQRRHRTHESPSE